MIRAFKIYLLPGLVFQSVVIGGGYGTGRELVEFFLKQGPVGGFLAMLTATVIWSAVTAVSFELARRARAFDYRTFVGNLLGPAAYVYEFVYISSTLLVVSVVAAASGELLNGMLGLTRMHGAILAMGLVAVIVFFGTPLIEKLFTVWSTLLYVAYLVLVVACFAAFGDTITGNAAVRHESSSWLMSGIRFASYNIGAVPITLICVRRVRTRREAMGAGLLCGPIAMLPGLLLYLALLSHYPEILDAPIPTTVVVASLGWALYQLVFQVLLLGTIIDTGAAMLHGLNERIAASLAERSVMFPALARGAVGVGVFVLAVFAAERFGLINLIARGYGTIGWLGAAAFVLPVLTIGAYRVFRRSG